MVVSSSFSGYGYFQNNVKSVPKRTKYFLKFEMWNNLYQCIHQYFICNLRNINLFEKYMFAIDTQSIVEGY